MSEQLETHGDLIPSQALKVYARKKGFLIKGFNDTIIEESVQASGSPDTDHSALTLELNQYKHQFEQSQSEINSLRARIVELEQQASQQQNENTTKTAFHPSIDPSNPKHAPELIIAIQVWEDKYQKNKYPHDQHTPAIEKILRASGQTNQRLIARVAAITNPNKNNS
ncbi:MAG: hypothetical protein NVS3B3_19960 [Aquirhabdus sp.]